MIAVSRPWAGVAALCGLVGLLLCAFASHGVDDPQHGLWLRIGGFCLLMHAIVAINALALIHDELGRVVAALFLLGCTIFTGMLTIIVFGGPRWLGAVVPFGGLLMIMGWLMMAWAFFRPIDSIRKQPEQDG